MIKRNALLNFWFTPLLPNEHIKPNGFRKTLLNWVYHPIRRRFAKYYLLALRALSLIKVIGITGSTGKTTTKEMLASILKLEGNTVWSRDNIDPIYNIPSTIFRTGFGTKYLILEMGVEFPGEMDFYLWMARPDIGVITNIYPTHTEFFGDTGGVFKEKSKLVKALGIEGMAVLNSENKFLKGLKDKLVTKILWFGDGTEVMFSLEETTADFQTQFLLILNHNENLRTKITLPVLGHQFVYNALASAATAISLGVSLEKIKKGLEEFTPAVHRMKVIKHASGALILDDSYNNNPQAAKEAISTFLQVTGSRDKVVVFGDMLELGDLEEKYHKELGEILGKSGLVKLVCVGKATQKTAESAAKMIGSEKVTSVPTYNEAEEQVRPFLRRNTAILIKGSRSIHLEYLVAAIGK